MERIGQEQECNKKEELARRRRRVEMAFAERGVILSKDGGREIDWNVTSGSTADILMGEHTRNDFVENY